MARSPARLVKALAGEKTIGDDESRELIRA